MDANTHPDNRPLPARFDDADDAVEELATYIDLMAQNEGDERKRGFLLSQALKASIRARESMQDVREIIGPRNR